jgi:hypothetical protein
MTINVELGIVNSEVKIAQSRATSLHYGRARLRRAVTRFRGKYYGSKLDTDKDAQHIVLESPYRSKANPQSAIPLAPLYSFLKPSRTSQTRSNPVKPGQTNMVVVKNRHFVLFPPHFGNQDPLASDIRWPFTIHHSPFTIPPGQTQSNLVKPISPSSAASAKQQIRPSSPSLRGPANPQSAIGVAPRRTQSNPVKASQTNPAILQRPSNSIRSVRFDRSEPFVANPQSAIRNPQLPPLHHSVPAA